MVVDTEKYQRQVELLAKELRRSIKRAEALEDAILAYLSEAQRTGTMNPKNLTILRDSVTRNK